MITSSVKKNNKKAKKKYPIKNKVGTNISFMVKEDLSGFLYVKAKKVLKIGTGKYFSRSTKSVFLISRDFLIVQR